MPFEVPATFRICLNDSELASVRPQGASMVLRLAAAQAQCTAASATVHAGYLPGVLLTLHGARLTLGAGTALSDCVGTVHEGQLRLNGQSLPRWWSLPARWAGELELQLALRNRASLRITAHSAELTVPDGAIFRESMAC